MSEKIKDMKANILRLLTENAGLKRERDEVQYNFEDARQSLEVALEDLSEAKRERDEARNELEMWRDGNIMHENHNCELEKAEYDRNEAREQLRIAVGLLSTHPQFANKHPEDVLAFVKEGGK